MRIPPLLPSNLRLLLFAALTVALAGALASKGAEASPASSQSLLPSPHKQVSLLLAELDRYKRIEGEGGWPYVPSGPVLEKGAAGARVAALRQRLAAEGDLPAGQIPGQMFDETLSTAVRRFQERHGLAVDGRVGLETLAALNVSTLNRVAQIAANIERWREMPAELPKRRLEVNIPAAELTVLEDDEPVLRMRVVVGSRRFPTPLLESRIQSVVVNPPWNVPPRIARNEILPRLRRDPGYLRDNDIRILDFPDDPYGEQVAWRDLRPLPTLRLRQEPGPKNALGRIKFDIPNGHAVYLHDTPVKSAFNLANRALSHGCVRVQHPEALARYLLHDQLVGNSEMIDGALANSETVTIAVPTPLLVLFVYRTAYVEGGRLNFRRDIYGYDARLGELPYLTGESGTLETAVALGCSADSTDRLMDPAKG